MSGSSRYKSAAPLVGSSEGSLIRRFSPLSFLPFNPHDRLPILKTPGVTQIVGYNHVPVPVDEQEIQAIRRLVVSGVPNFPVRIS